MRSPILTARAIELLELLGDSNPRILHGVAARGQENSFVSPSQVHATRFTLLKSIVARVSHGLRVCKSISPQLSSGPFAPFKSGFPTFPAPYFLCEKFILRSFSIKGDRCDARYS